MQLTGAQLDTLKTWLTANASGLTDEEAKALLNAPASPTYKMWRSRLSKQDLIEQPDLDSASATTTFITGGGAGSYIDRTVGERDGFLLLFNTSLACKPYLANVRIAMFDVFSGTNANSQMNRRHFWARGQRAATVAEHLYRVATAGGPTHDASNGNNPAGQTGTRGGWTNPDTFGTGEGGAILEGEVTIDNISEARNRP